MDKIKSKKKEIHTYIHLSFKDGKVEKMYLLSSSKEKLVIDLSINSNPFLRIERFLKETKTSYVYVYDLALFMGYFEGLLQQLKIKLCKTFEELNKNKNGYMPTVNNNMYYAMYLKSNYLIRFYDIANIFPNVSMEEMKDILIEKYPYINRDDEFIECFTIHYMLVLEYKMNKSIKRKSTRSSYAFDKVKEYIEMEQKVPFIDIFPHINDEDFYEMNNAYFGGKMYIKEPNKVYKNVLQLDINSSYPSVMMEALLPFGKPSTFEGKYEYDEEYPLYIQKFTIKSFKLKDNRIPSLNVQLAKPGKSQIITEEDLMPKNEIIYLSNVDFDLFLYNYSIEGLTYHGGFKFKGMRGLFKTFINDFYEGKKQAKIKQNTFETFYYKSMINFSYGKFGQKRHYVNSFRSKSIVELNKEIVQQVKNERVKSKNNGEGYLPMAIFIAAYARKKLFDMFKGIEDKVLYCDTDCLHIEKKHVQIETKENKKYFNGQLIDKYQLGAWDIEKEYIEIKYLKPKVYMGIETNGELVFKAAGLTKEDKNLFISKFKNNKECFNHFLPNVSIERKTRQITNLGFEYINGFYVL